MEVLMALVIGHAVATLLLNSNRVLKAIKLLKECLIVLSNEALKREKELVTVMHEAIYHQIIDGYCLINDCRNAIKCGRELLVLHRGSGERDKEGMIILILANVHIKQRKYHEAKKLYAEALNIMKEIGDRNREAVCYGSLGYLLDSLGEYAKAKEYHEEALAITKDIGDKRNEAACYGNLGRVFCSLGEYTKAKECHEKVLVIAKEIGAGRAAEAWCYANLGFVCNAVCEYVKAKEYYEKAVTITKEIGDRRNEASCYGNLGTVFSSLGEYTKAKEYHEKVLVIAKEIGAGRDAEAWCYANLGSVFASLCEYAKAKEYLEKALKIAKEIGNREKEALCYGNLGTVFRSLDEYAKAKKYHEKALVIAKEIGGRDTEAWCYVNLGSVFESLGEYAKAKQYYEKALAMSKETGKIDIEIAVHANFAATMLLEGNIHEAKSYLLTSIDKFESIRSFLTGYDQFKISFFDQHVYVYRVLSYLFCVTGNLAKALYIVEIGRARALADLMSAQYSLEKEISVNPQTWVGIERIMEKESNCSCLYISYWEQMIYLWILKANKPMRLRQIDVNDCFINKASVRKVDGVLGNATCRMFHALSQEQCEDRSWFSSNVNHSTCTSTQKDSLAGCRLVVDEEDENQQPDPTLAEGYKMIIAPVADLLYDAEIIIVPDRSFFQVPFAALEDESGKYFSETFRIRIVPSLTTLKLIHNSRSDYHSQTDALVVGDPDVGQVLYKGNPTIPIPLPCAREEAEMVGELLGVNPLLGQQATKQAALEKIDSVSLIHFAAHGDAERGEIVLAPPPLTNRIPQEKDYLLTMADISKFRLRAKPVVLSCCHSAHGRIRAEGVVGIARAFLGSGARSVLVALWAIEDRATKEFMSRFYEHLFRGETASESLHQAMKWMRANGFSKIGQWAPFMLIGDNVTFDFRK